MKKIYSLLSFIFVAVVSCVITNVNRDNSYSLSLTTLTKNESDWNLQAANVKIEWDTIIESSKKKLVFLKKKCR